MIKLLVSVVFRLGGTKKALAALKSPQGPFAGVIPGFAVIYRTATVKRFDRFSKGGGDWPKLKKSTERRKKSTAILVDTRLMRQGLAADIACRLESAGNKWKLVFYVKRNTKHPRAKMVVTDLAAIHHFGLGRVPERKIVVAPPPEVKDRVKQKLFATLAKIMKSG